MTAHAILASTSATETDFAPCDELILELVSRPGVRTSFTGGLRAAALAMRRLSALEAGLVARAGAAK